MRDCRGQIMGCTSQSPLPHPSPLDQISFHSRSWGTLSQGPGILGSLIYTKRVWGPSSSDGGLPLMCVLCGKSLTLCSNGSRCSLYKRGEEGGWKWRVGELNIHAEWKNCKGWDGHSYGGTFPLQEKQETRHRKTQAYTNRPLITGAHWCFSKELFVCEYICVRACVF